MDIDFYKPKNKILQKYIEGFYFISEDKKSKPINYLTFPNNYCILTINRNFKVDIINNVVTLRSSFKKNIITSLVSSYTDPIHIHYKNLIDEITIYFKPLGINHLIENTTDLFKNSTHIDFLFSLDFNEKISNIFELKREEQVSQLEAYLSSKVKSLDLHKLYAILYDLENGLTISKIAEKYNFTRQYINKLFSKHIGKSPSEYRKISRFRNALINSKGNKKFEEIYQYGFYDQSHFIRNFKQFTGKKPSSFFKNVDIEKDNIWLFI